MVVRRSMLQELVQVPVRILLPGVPPTHTIPCKPAFAQSRLVLQVFGTDAGV